MAFFQPKMNVDSPESFPVSYLIQVGMDEMLGREEQISLAEEPDFFANLSSQLITHLLDWRRRVAHPEADPADHPHSCNVLRDW